MAIWKIDGFEHGDIQTGADGVYDHITANATIVTSPARSGARALKIAAAGAQTRAAYDLPASTRQVTMSFALRFTTADGLPAANCQLAVFGNANGNGQLRYRTSTGRLCVAHASVGNVDIGPVLAVDTWYWIDLTYDSSGTIASLLGCVDNGGEGLATRTQAAADCTEVDLGTVSGETFIAYYDDWVMSFSRVDYPLTSHRIEGLIPSADGTHNITTAGAFTSNTATIFTNGSTNGNTFIGHRPLQLTDTANQVIRQTAGGVTEYMELLLENLPSGTSTPDAARAYGVHVESGSGGASLGEARLLLSTNVEVLTEGSLSVIDTTEDPGTLVTLRKRMCLDPSGGWDRTKVNGLKARVGFADGAPNVNFIDFMVEVALLDEVIVATPSKVSAMAAVATPTITRGAGAAPDIIPAVADIPTPAAHGSAFATPARVAATTSVATPTVVAGGAVSPTPTRIAAVAAVRTPSITTGAASADMYSRGYGAQGYETIEEEVVEPPPPVPEPRTSATTPTVRVRVDWIHDLNITDVQAPPPRWEDISALLRSPEGVNIRRGRERSIDKNEAGTAALVFGDPDRILDSDNIASPYFPFVTTDRRINIQAVVPDLSEAFVVGYSFVGGTDIVGGGDTSRYIDLFDGVIDTYTYDYPGQGRDTKVTIQCTDLLAAMSKDEQQFQSHDFVRTADEVFNSILNQRAYTGRVGFGITPSPLLRDIPDNGWEPIALAPMIFNSLKQAVDVIADSEGGNFYIARDGKPTYKFRAWTDQPPDPELRFAIDAIRYRDVQFRMDEQIVYNDITVTDWEGNIGAQVTDEASIRAHWQKEFTLATAMNTPGQMEERAFELLFNYSEPRKFINMLDLSNVIEDWAKVLSCDLWSKGTLDFFYPNGDFISQTSLVEGIQITTGNHRDWKLVWWLSVPPFRNILATTIQDSTFEESGVGSIGSWTMESAGTLSAVNQEYTRYTTGRNDNVVEQYVPIAAPQGTFVLWADPTVNGDSTFLGPVIDVLPRERYLARVKGRSVEFLGDGPHTASTFSDPHQRRIWRVEFDWYGPTMNFLSREVGASVGTEFDPSGWSQAELLARAPSGALFMRMRVRTIEPGAFRAGHFIDDVLITRVV